jgi:FAD/FMN-containing dehydrogenase
MASISLTIRSLARRRRSRHPRIDDGCIGASRRPFLEEQVDTDAVEVMRAVKRAVKRALDPAGILNPGRVL